MISEDEKFCMPKNVRIKKELLENYKDMLEFIKISWNWKNKYDKKFK